MKNITKQINRELQSRNKNLKEKDQIEILKLTSIINKNKNLPLDLNSHWEMERNGIQNPEDR
jgi:hypothetical protein